ncbi:hypothetical protein B0H21DRAFT_723311 [Amylocystis lapponica]|nr:hypothetical protein B0H21DRAFT_723311 [Amylocystis lapponica]
MQVSKPSRHRSIPASDPFSDSTIAPSYSAYGVPTLARNAPAQNQQTQRAPPPPPKGTTKSSPAKRQVTMNRDNVADAVRDTVTVRHADQSPRTRMARSNTEAPPLVRPTAAPTSRRSLSQDSVLRAANSVEKGKTGGTRARGAKKGSTHADVIDRLDFSGVGPMFHHDGPFDACAPSRNRHRTKAPMLAWSAVTDADKQALASAHDVQPSPHQSPYPAPSQAIYVPYEPPKKKHDAIAEAWGIHEPEPFEDFSAGGGYTARGNSELRGTTPTRNSPAGPARRSKEGRTPRDMYREYLDDPQAPPTRRQQTKRSLPPPAPIFVSEGEAEGPPSPTDPPSPGQPKRNKSIIRRIRKMRDSPNVPVGFDDDARIVAGNNGRDPSPTSSAENSAATHTSSNAHATRPTHRAQNSFLGRFGRAATVGPSGRRDDLSPVSDDGGSYVYVDEPAPVNKEKSLPATPPMMMAAGSPPGEYGGDYFDGPLGTPGGTALGRKTSLLRKVRAVVQGNAAK